MSRKAKQLWNPQIMRPQARQEEEDTWAASASCTTSDGSGVTFKAGSKLYALDASISRTNKISELFLKRIYRYVIYFTTTKKTLKLFCPKSIQFIRFNELIIFKFYFFQCPLAVGKTFLPNQSIGQECPIQSDHENSDRHPDST
jgi:hypothetical protein